MCIFGFGKSCISLLVILKKVTCLFSISANPIQIFWIRVDATLLEKSQFHIIFSQVSDQAKATVMILFKKTKHIR